MEGYTKVNGKTIRDMVEVMNDTQMAISIKVNFNMGKHMAKADINGWLLRSCTMESGQKACDMDMGFGNAQILILTPNTMIHTSENGEMAKQKDMVCIPGAMVINTKANGNNA